MLWTRALATASLGAIGLFAGWPGALAAVGIDDPGAADRSTAHPVQVAADDGLVKRWLLGTHHGAVGKKHLPADLDEFVFRFNRRTARKLSHRFGRVIEHAVQIAPTTCGALVAQPEPA